MYYRLLDIIFKLDCIEGEGSGSEYIGLTELGTDHKLSNKFNVIAAAMWADPDQISQLDRRDWLSVLEAIERDIAALNNHYKFKRLLDKVGDESRNLDDIFTKGWEIKGPWNQIVDTIRQDFE